MKATKNGVHGNANDFHAMNAGAASAIVNVH